MRLRCGGAFNDYLITHLLLSFRVKEFRNLANICRSYGPESSVQFVCFTVFAPPCTYSQTITVYYIHWLLHINVIIGLLVVTI